MQSILDPTIVYEVSQDVCEHDVDVVSDLWTMDDRNVYRGSRDTQYSHANVYWLYDEDLTRVGLIEHSLKDHADFRILWFYETPFATYLQEDNWTQDQTIWTVLSPPAVERCLAEDWTTPETLLEACLHGDTRILTLDMILNPPRLHGCSGCNRKSLKKLECENMTGELTFPVKEKIVFIDDDLFVCVPPTGSRIWELLGFEPKSQHPLVDGGQSSLEQVSEEQALVQVPELELTALESPLPESALPLDSHLTPQLEPEPSPQTPPLPQTLETLSHVGEQKPERTRFAMSLQIPVPRRRYSG
jgi:hypothetical protein